MKNFKYLLLASIIFFTGCNSSHGASDDTLKSEARVCPMCHMEVDNSNEHSSSLIKRGKTYYFDDIGCMILWSGENSASTVSAKVFSKDTKQYISAKSANYTFGEKTPMSYGFSAYENSVDNKIDFDEVITKMLRGEHMANPKIRKQIIGY